MLEKGGCAETTASRGQSALLIIGTGIALLFTELERSQRKLKKNDHNVKKYLVQCSVACFFCIRNQKLVRSGLYNI